MNVNDEIIQKLIDGELEESSRRELLEQIDLSSPHRWRDVALGFVEALVFSSVLRTQSNGKEEIKDKVSYFPKQAFAIAAALVLGIAGGIFFSYNERSQRDRVAEALPEKRQIEKSRIYPIQSAQFNVDQDYGFSSDSEDIEIRRILSNSFGMMEKVRAAYGQQGYDSSQLTGYISASLKGGRELVIPINYVSIFQNK